VRGGTLRILAEAIDLARQGPREAKCVAAKK